MPHASIHTGNMSSLALLTPVESTKDRWYILYDYKRLRADWALAIDEVGDNKATAHYFEENPENSFIKAAIAVTSKPSGKQWNVPTVNNSVAQPGYGPMLYDIVMFYEGGLAPDRSMVSQSAQKVWDYYAYNRDDVKKKKFDDVDFPRTPPKIDDATVNDESGPDGPLNHAYFIDHIPPTVGIIINNHKFFSKEFITPKNISLAACAMRFFRKRYRAQL